MSDDSRSPGVAQWGRPLRKKSRGPQAQPDAASGPVVGPVDDAEAGRGAETIIRAAGNGAPRPQTRREPDAEDLKFKDLVAHVARGLVDHPDDVDVVIL